MKSIIVGAFALSIGVGLGFLAAGGEPEPTVKTVTEEVEVPGPTVTEEVEVEKQVEVATTPQACLDAITAAEQGFTLSGEFAESSVEVSELLFPTLKAGYNRDVAAMERITADVERITADVRSINGRLSDTADQFNAAKAECRGGAS